MRVLGLTLVIVMLSAVSVSAQDGGGRRGGFDREAMMARMVGPMILNVADADASGDVPAKEWKAFMDSLTADKDGAIEGDAFKARIFTAMFDRNKNAKLEASDIAALHKELDKDANGVLAENELGGGGFARRGGRGRGEGGDSGGGDARPERIRLSSSMRTVAATFRDNADGDKSGDISADEWKKFIASMKTASGTVEAKTVNAWIAGPKREAPAEGEEGGRRGRRGGMGGFNRSIGGQLDMALGLAESKTFKKEKLIDIFMAMDSNEDGDITKEELSGRQRGRRGGGQGGGGPSTGGDKKKKSDEIL